MEVDTRMHAAGFLTTYPPHVFDSYSTLPSRDFLPNSSLPTSMMASSQGHNAPMTLPPLRGYSSYTGTGLAGSFGGDVSMYGTGQSSSMLSAHVPSNAHRYSSSVASQVPTSQYRLHDDAWGARPSPSSRSLSSTTSATLSSSSLLSSSASRRETRKSPNGEAERAPNAALLYEHSQRLFGSSSRGSSYGSNGRFTLPPVLPVEKQQVTTSATQAASASRRRNEAQFRCPVEGCGSTFTRRFNLRGHLRSHTEERPFVCEWPGCGKGFARQHDCKRHQALHTTRSQTSNVCQGCGKTFSRLDALNRHLKSDGATECKQTAQAVAIAARHSPNSDDWDLQSETTERKPSV